MITLHWIRPQFFWLLLPLGIFTWLIFHQATRASGAWQSICDDHLQPYIIQKQGKNTRWKLIYSLLTCLFSLIIALAGPSWKKLPSPTYQTLSPHIILLDMSDAMLATDLSPNRLTRAKFKLQDIFSAAPPGQWSLIAYTAEPFVVSPLTTDSQTINALLSSLSMDIMPLKGNDLGLALLEAQKQLNAAGYTSGEILVLTATPPSSDATAIAKKLSKQQLFTSILSVTADRSTKDFKPFVEAGKGQLVPFSDNPREVQKWLLTSKKRQYHHTILQANISDWQDEGRWFILPALLCLLPFFRRGGLECFSA